MKIYIDEKIITRINRTCVYQGNSKLYFLYIHLTGKKQIALSFETDAEREEIYKQLTATSREEVKNKLKIV